MPDWNSISVFQLNKEWAYSAPLQSNAIKFQSEILFPTLNTNQLFYNAKGLLSLAYFIDNSLSNPLFYSSQIIYPWIADTQVIIFPSFSFPGVYRLATKISSGNLQGNTWTLECWEYSEPIQTGEVTLTPDTINQISAAIELSMPYSYAGDYNNLGYQKTAETIEQFSYKASFDSGEVLWLTPSGGNVNGTITHNQQSSQRVLSIGTANGSKLITQTKQSFVYLAGNVHRFTNGLECQIPDGGVIEFGLFDENNGAFIRLTGTATTPTIEVVRRSKATGTVVDEVFSQSQFNVDKLDGTGSSGIALDLSHVQMWGIEFSWYGVGGIAFSVEINRQRHIFHWIGAGNRLDNLLFGDPDLPVRYHLYNTKATNQPTIAKIGGIFVGVDGSFDQRKGYNRGYVRPLRSVQAGQSYVLASIRPSPTWKGKNNRSYCRLEDFFVYGTADGDYSLQFMPTLTGASWQSVDSNASMMQYDIASTSATGGTILYCGAISSQNASDKKEILSPKDPLTAFSDGSGANSLAIVFNCTTNGNIACGFNWSEYY